MASYTDDFDRTDGSLGASWAVWEQDGGAIDPFAIVSNVVRGDNVDDFLRYYARYDTPLSSTNHKVTCTFTDQVVPGGTFWNVWGIYINGNDVEDADETMLVVQIRESDDETRLYLIETAGFTLLDSQGTKPATGSIMIIERIGSEVIVYDDGVEILSGSLTAAQVANLAGNFYGGMHYASGRVTDYAEFDDFTIEDTFSPVTTALQHVQMPVPGSMINLTSPLSQGLGYLAVANEQNGVVASERESDPTLRVPQANVGVGGAWAPEGLRVNNGSTSYPRYHGMNWTDTTALVLCLTVHEMVGANQGLVSKKNDSGNYWEVYVDRGDVVIAWNDGAATTVTFVDAWAGFGRHIYTIVYDGTWSIYVDGRLVDTDVETDRPGFIGDTIYSNWGCRNPADTANYIDATIHMSGFWIFHALQPGAIAALAKDPYAMMREPRFAIFPAIAAATGTGPFPTFRPVIS